MKLALRNTEPRGWRLFLSRENSTFYHHIEWFPTGKPPPSIRIGKGVNFIDVKIGEIETIDTIEDDCNPDENFNQMGKSCLLFKLLS